MKSLRRCVAVGCFVAAGGVLLYRFGLSDEARDQLKAAARSMRDAIQQINETIGAEAGFSPKPEDLPNRKKTEAQWEALGY